jgi:hypothetical protein
MKTKLSLAALLTLVAIIASGCGLAGNLLGGSKGGTVSTLWSDVPALPNAKQANIQMPPLANLIIQGFVAAANSDSSNDTKLDKFDFIAFQTADTPQSVADFYTVDKMTAAGWNAKDTAGCQAGTQQAGAAGFCAFGKTAAGGKQTILLIMPVQDDSTKTTQVFFVRFEATNKTTTP